MASKELDYLITNNGKKLERKNEDLSSPKESSPVPDKLFDEQMMKLFHRSV